MDILKDFGVEPLLLLAQIINFVILLVILKKFLYVPILKQLEKRKKEIAETENKNREIAESLEKTKKQESLIIAKAEKEAEKIITDARNFAKLESQKIIDNTNEEARQMIISTKTEIEAERQKAYVEARKELTGLVVMATNRLTGKVLTKKDQQNLIKESITEAKVEQKES